MGQYAVIGLGNFGFNVAISLAEMGHEVLAIDSNSKRIDQIKENVMEAIVADGKDKKVLSEFITKNFDAVVVNLGESIEASALTVLYLKEMGIKNIVVKVAEEIQGAILKKIGASEIVNPEKESAIRLAERLVKPNLIDHIPLAAEYSIIEIALPDKFAGKSLKELDVRRKYGIEVIAVKDVLLNKFKLIPDAGYKLSPDNVLVVIGKNEDIANVSL
jgi:trk system potassium uptake protein TrkA